MQVDKNTIVLYTAATISLSNKVLARISLVSPFISVGCTVYFILNVLERAWSSFGTLHEEVQTNLMDFRSRVTSFVVVLCLSLSSEHSFRSIVAPSQLLWETIEHGPFAQGQRRVAHVTHVQEAQEH